MNPASEQYELGSPIFEKVTLSVAQDKEFIITAKHTSPTNKYIQAARLNGELLQRSYITHEELITGGTLEFEMGPEPNKSWGV